MYKRLIMLLGLLLCLLPGVARASDLFYPTGTYTTSAVDLKVAARSIPMTWERSYRSNRVVKEPGVSFFEFLLPVDGPLGFGWSSPWTMKLTTVEYKDADEVLHTQVRFHAADGRNYAFEPDADGNYPADTVNGYELVAVTGGFELRQRGANTLLFNAAGQLTAVRDPRGQSATLVYSGEQLSAIQDVSGRTVYTLAWTADNKHISRITDLTERSIDYVYDTAGRLIRVRQGDLLLVSYGYNPEHGLTIESNALNESWRIGYTLPERGVVARITDPVGKTLTLKADFNNRLYTLTGYDGVTRRFILDGGGNVVSDSEIQNGQVLPRRTVQYQPGGSKKTLDSAGNATSEERDTWGNVTKRTDAEGNTTTFTYNLQGKPLTIVDGEGVTTAFSYDSSGTLPTRIVRAQGRPEQVSTDFTYTPQGDLETTSTDGAVTRFTYNAAGLPLTVSDPLGNITTFEYDTVGNLIAAVDALDHRSTFTYDSRGNLLTAGDPLTNTTTYAYNLAGRLKSVIDPLGHITATSTDFAGRITSLIPPAGAAKTFAYDGAGNLIRIVQGTATTQLAYDSRDRLTSVIDPEGNSTGYSYDATGCAIGCGASNDIPKSITDPFGSVTENLFDKTGKVIGVQDPLGHLTSLGLDHNGRVASRSDANGKTTTYTYDGLGRVTKQTDAGGGITAFTFDPRGNLLTLSDPQGNITTFTYDKAGRKTKETRPLGQTTSYTYTANGLLKTVKDAKNQITTYSYDAAGRLSEVLYADGQKDSFGYDASGNLTSYANTQVSGAMTYDPAGRKSSEAVTVGSVTKSYSYTYDPQGNKASYTSPEGINHSYQHDKAGKLTGISFDGKTITLNYDKTRLKQMNYPNGVSNDYAYNAANWLTGITTTKAGTTLLSRGYNFDSVGNITGQESEHGATGYGYDDLYQLTNADHPDAISLTDEAYSYDKVGNRASSAATTGSWSYNKNNELQNSSAASYEYDANGNTIKKTETSQVTLYHYDARNRLSQVTLPDGSIATYAYDPFGRRVMKSLATQTTLYTYADEGLIGEYDASDGSVQSVYGWKPDGLWGTDPLYLKQNGVLAFYHNNHLGTPQKLTDGQGGVVWSATYAAFGLATVDAESTITNNLRFPGQYWDAETNLHYNFLRYYEFEAGRYIAKDPIGILSGRNHLFTYVQSSPINFIDPFGLCSKANPAPKNLIGTCGYYIFRAYDFYKRNGYLGDEQSYYMNYGYKYCDKFNNVTYFKLSKAGKEWVEATTRILQEKLEEELASNSNVECCGLKKAAFDSHPDAYMEGGLEGLGLIDKVKILNTVDEIDTDAVVQATITLIYLIGAIQQY